MEVAEILIGPIRFRIRNITSPSLYANLQCNPQLFFPFSRLHAIWLSSVPTCFSVLVSKRSYYLRCQGTAIMELYKNAVAVIAGQVRQFYETSTPFRIYHSSTSSTRTSQYRRDAIIDTSQLSRLLKVDSNAKAVLVEPNVPMDDIVAQTLPLALIPPVVMEFPGITVGGGFAGTSGESSSFKHGFFENTVNWIEILLANGDVINASPTENPDLFHAAASSFGTLGVVTLLEVQLVEATTYVELTYHPVSSIQQAIRISEDATADSDYLDSILFVRNRGIVCTGRLTNVPSEGIRIQQFSRPKDPCFYHHAEKILQKYSSLTTEAIPLVDYLFRYDRGGFWVGRYAFRYFIDPFNRVTRWILDRYMPTRVMYHALHKSGIAKRYIVQDVEVPYSTTSEFVRFLDELVGFYPVWLCPLRATG